MSKSLTFVFVFFLQRLPDTFPYICKPVWHLTLVKSSLLAQFLAVFFLQVRVIGILNEPAFQNLSLNRSEILLLVSMLLLNLVHRFVVSVFRNIVQLNDTVVSELILVRFLRRGRVLWVIVEPLPFERWLKIVDGTLVIVQSFWFFRQSFTFFSLVDRRSFVVATVILVLKRILTCLGVIDLRILVIRKNGS